MRENVNVKHNQNNQAVSWFELQVHWVIIADNAITNMKILQSHSGSLSVRYLEPINDSISEDEQSNQAVSRKSRDIERFWIFIRTAV